MVKLNLTNITVTIVGYIFCVYDNVAADPSYDAILSKFCVVVGLSPRNRKVKTISDITML